MRVSKKHLRAKGAALRGRRELLSENLMSIYERQLCFRHRETTLPRRFSVARQVLIENHTFLLAQDTYLMLCKISRASAKEERERGTDISFIGTRSFREI